MSENPKLPEKRPKRSLTVEIDTELYAKIKEIAKKGNLSMRGVVEFGLEYVVKTFGEKTKSEGREKPPGSCL